MRTLPRAAGSIQLLLSLLAVHDGAAGQSAVTPQPDASNTPDSQVVVVRASADASAKGLLPAYPGGQVARGGRIGVLGDQDMMDAPFAITSYTNQLIQDQQSRSVGDVLQNDPSVRVARGFGNFQESYFIRGFLLSSDDVAYNGLYNLLPRQFISADLFERVEVLKGASAFLNGASPGGDAIGGAINLLPKRAPDEPLTQFSGGASSGSQTYEAIDLGRRFLAGKSAGLRLTASRRSGGTGVDDENVDTNVFLLGADWRDRVVRLSADVGAQENRLKQPRTNVTLATGVTAVPRAPDASSNWAQSWSYSNESDVFGTLRAEAEIRPAWTAWLALGGRESHEANSLANVTVQDTAGDATTYRFDNRRRDRVRTGDLGLRGAITTGEISHAIVLSAASFLLEKRNAYATSSTAAASLLHTNLHAPVDSDAPALVVFGNDLDTPRLTSRIRLRSVALADTLGFADDTVLLSLGLRRQKFDIQSFAYTTGAAGAPYSKSRTSPVAAVVFKVSPHVSAYANVIESLAQGETAPSTAANFGAQLAPYVAKQKEVGLKFDGGHVGGGVAFFSTAKPRSFIDADMVFVAAGEDRHQGFELSMFGEPAVGLKLLAGVTFINAKQRSTGVAATEGKRVIGVPSAQGNLTVAWGVPGASGLSIDGSIVATGAVRANATNTLTAPAWTREDVGAKVVTRLAGRELVMRLRVDNVANARYWSSAGGYPNLGYLVLASPRTLSVSASIDL